MCCFLDHNALQCNEASQIEPQGQFSTFLPLLFSASFLFNLGGKKKEWVLIENFIHLVLFSLFHSNQTTKSYISLFVFLHLFFIPSLFTPAKHSVREKDKGKTNAQIMFGNSFFFFYFQKLFFFLEYKEKTIFLYF